MLRTLPKPTATAALMLTTLTLAGCGESAQEKAMAQVCKARSNISQEITKLEGLPVSSSFLSEAKKSVEAIDKDLKEIRAAQPNLEPARREQVKAATASFEKQMSTLAAGLTSGILSGVGAAQLQAAGPQIKAGLSQLANAYKQAYGPISCPS